ncbi:MAG: hypothetical protein JSS82_16155 [Bacteroidetes bacterium]|nr:hypothetical protein [Bacteroidota bacterium]
MIVLKRAFAICCLLHGIYVSRAQNVMTANPNRVVVADVNATAPAANVTLAPSELSTDVKLVSPDNKVTPENVNKSVIGANKTDRKLIKPVSQEHLDKKKRIK